MPIGVIGGQPEKDIIGPNCDLLDPGPPLAQPNVLRTQIADMGAPERAPSGYGQAASHESDLRMQRAPFDAFLSGVAVALAVAMPIGPMAVLCIQQTLAFGLTAGLTIGLAAATVQVCYGLVAALGYSGAVMALVGAGASLFCALSAVLLFWFAFRVSRAKLTVAHSDAKMLCRWRSYRGALTFGFANPLTPILFFAAFPALTPLEGLAGAPVLIGGVFVGASGWYVLLSSTVALWRRRFPPRLLIVANKASGLVLAGLGLLMLANAFGMR